MADSFFPCARVASRPCHRGILADYLLGQEKPSSQLAGLVGLAARCHRTIGGTPRLSFQTAKRPSAKSVAVCLRASAQPSPRHPSHPPMHVRHVVLATARCPLRTPRPIFSSEYLAVVHGGGEVVMRRRAELRSQHALDELLGPEVEAGIFRGNSICSGVVRRPGHAGRCIGGLIHATRSRPIGSCEVQSGSKTRRKDNMISPIERYSHRRYVTPRASNNKIIGSRQQSP